MKDRKYVYGIPEDELRKNLASWLENPSWREYYETAPSEQCRTLISVEFWESEHGCASTDKILRYMEKDLSLEDWRHLYRWCGNNPRKKFIHDRMAELEQENETPENPPYLCHLCGMEDVKEAMNSFRGTVVRDYGEALFLEDGTYLHGNYPELHDGGGRELLRCKICGALVLVQHSWMESPYMFYDDPDEFYCDYIPVASVEEADLLNILWDGKELMEYPFRHLQRHDTRFRLTEGKEPVPHDPEELKERIRKKNADLSKEHKAMLEKLIREAGKEEAGTSEKEG